MASLVCVWPIGAWRGRCYPPTIGTMAELPLPPPASRPRRLRVDVGTIITVGVLGQAALLIGMGYWGAERIVGTLASSVHRADHQRVEDRIRAFLNRGVAVARTMAAAPALAPAGRDSAASAELMWALLSEAPELDSVYVADAAGRMLMVLRYPQPAVRYITRAGGVTHERWEFKRPDSDGGDAHLRFATQRTVERQSQYDPLARRWYQQAVGRQQAIWTEPYVFDAARELGVTYAMPLPRPGEASGPAAVVATDITLGRLSDFVRQFSHSGYGDSALLSASGMVLARSDHVGVPQLLAPPQGGVLGALVQQLGHPPLERRSFDARIEGESYLVQASTVPATGWTLLSWVPERKVLGGLRDGVFWGFGAALLFLALMLVMSWRVARGITQPIERLARNARRIGQLQVRNLPRVNSRLLEIQHLDQALDESARGLQAFMKFAPVDVVNQLMAQGHTLRPGGESRVLTIMFVDVRGFTQIAETVPAEQLAQQLTRFFNVAARVITSFGGTIDKFIGDGLMVLWGAPLQLDRPELQACKAALALQRAMDTQNARWRRAFLPEFAIGIGIHTGPVVAGVLGAADRLAYTALGDSVNVASRVEDLNRQLGTRILVSETTRAGLDGRLPTRVIGTMPLRGRQTPLEVSELLESGVPLPP